MRSQNLKIIYFVAVDWFFFSHFLARARAAEQAGHEIVVVTSVSSATKVDESSFRFINLDIDRRSINPFSALRIILKLVRVFRMEKPDIIHQVSMKPILLGGVAARFAGVKRVVNAFVGGGYAFYSSSPLMRVFRPFLSVWLRVVLSFPGIRVIFENSDDLNLFVRNRWALLENCVLIRGAGVNPSAYTTRSTPNAVPLVVLPARLLWDKGLAEFVGAARLLRSQGVKARFAILGGADSGNRGGVPSVVLEKWQAEGVVEFWGFQTDMPKVLAQADIVCLPSYGEGLPKALLEGMAAGLPCVATDVPGCREAVTHGDNGFLVPVRDVSSLAKAIEILLSDPGLAQRLGERGRQRVELEFAERYVNDSTLRLYREMFEH